MAPSCKIGNSNSNLELITNPHVQELALEDAGDEFPRQRSVDALLSAGGACLSDYSVVLATSSTSWGLRVEVLKIPVISIFK